MGKTQDKAIEPARQFQGLAKICAVTALVAINSACAGGGDTMNTTQTSTSAATAPKVSLVEAWKMKMTRVDDGHVRIYYQPLMSSALVYPGAIVKTDGKRMQVSLPKCLVGKHCDVDVASKAVDAPGGGFGYEVIVPFKGETVMVDGAGPVVEELHLTK